MKKIKKHYILLISIFIFSFCSCNKGNELIIEKDTNVIINSMYYVKIYFRNSSTKIINAYIDCNEPIRTIDTGSFEIKECRKLLMVDNDTVKIRFIPTKTGLDEFNKISLLVRENNSRFQIIDTTFEYFVTPTRPRL